MTKTRIEWCDYTINPVKGLCPVACPFCYARRIYNRFKWNPELRYDEDILRKPLLGKPGDRYFIGSTMELFGEWVEDWIMQNIFNFVKCYPERTFIFLTKRPENLAQWSPFPENCWVGVSVPRYWDDSAIGHPEAFKRISKLGEVTATVKFVSFEPLLEDVASNSDFGLDMDFKAYSISWIILGQQTPVKASTAPKIEWIREIVEAADKAGIPVFLKNNLTKGVIDASCDWAFNKSGYRQEFPVTK